MKARGRRIRPGWYVLVLLFVYAVVSTVLLQRTNAEVRQLRIDAATVERAAPAAPVESGLWLPIPGATLPISDAHLPGSERPYRNGVSEGFDFYDGEAGVPIPYGAPVVAAGSGVLERVDAVYTEMTPAAFEALMSDVSEGGASAEELDRLRGRQVWLRLEDGRLLRYAHLASTRTGLAAGHRVSRGQVIGYVGNSGTDAGVAGTERQARLHFEIWDGERFFGEGLDADEVRIAAASLFTGP